MTSRAIAGSSSRCRACPVVKTTRTNFNPSGVSTYAASWRAVLVQPAFDHSREPGGRAFAV
jgi:hypothetical protein